MVAQWSINVHRLEKREICSPIAFRAIFSIERRPRGDNRQSPQISTKVLCHVTFDKRQPISELTCKSG